MERQQNSMLLWNKEYAITYLYDNIKNDENKYLTQRTKKYNLKFDKKTINL